MTNCLAFLGKIHVWACCSLESCQIICASLYLGDSHGLSLWAWDILRDLISLLIILACPCDLEICQIVWLSSSLGKWLSGLEGYEGKITSSVVMPLPICRKGWKHFIVYLREFLSVVSVNKCIIFHLGEKVASSDVCLVFEHVHTPFSLSDIIRGDTCQNSVMKISKSTRIASLICAHRTEITFTHGQTTHTRTWHIWYTYI